MMKVYVSPEEIDNLTAYHPPKNETVKHAHELVRALVRHVMHELNMMLAESPQKTHLIRQMIPQIMMAANQVVAVHGINEEYFLDDFLHTAEEDEDK